MVVNLSKVVYTIWALIINKVKVYDNKYTIIYLSWILLQGGLHYNLTMIQQLSFLLVYYLITRGWLRLKTPHRTLGYVLGNMLWEISKRLKFLTKGSIYNVSRMLK